MEQRFGRCPGIIRGLKGKAYKTVRVSCPFCGNLARINEDMEIAIHYGPPEDVDEDDYELPCEGSGQEFSGDPDDEVLEDEDKWAFTRRR